MRPSRCCERVLEAARDRGFLPQWRAAHWNSASIALAHRLGLALVGHQYSVTFDHSQTDSRHVARPRVRECATWVVLPEKCSATYGPHCDAA